MKIAPVVSNCVGNSYSVNGSVKPNNNTNKVNNQLVSSEIPVPSSDNVSFGGFRQNVFSLLTSAMLLMSGGLEKAQAQSPGTIKKVLDAGRQLVVEFSLGGKKNEIDTLTRLEEFKTITQRRYYAAPSGNVYTQWKGNKIYRIKQVFDDRKVYYLVTNTKDTIPTTTPEVLQLQKESRRRRIENLDMLFKSSYSKDYARRESIRSIEIQNHQK